MAWQAVTVAANVPDKPGLLDNQSFKQHWSVEFWRDFQVPETISDDSTPLPSRRGAFFVRHPWFSTTCHAFTSGALLHASAGRAVIKSCEADPVFACDCFKHASTAVEVVISADTFGGGQAADDRADADGRGEQRRRVQLVAGRAVLGLPHHPLGLLCLPGHRR